MINKKQALHLFQEGYTTAIFGYANGNIHPDNIFTFKVLLEDNFAENDSAIVDTSSGLKLLKCLEVHDKPKIDLYANHDYKWVIQKVNFERYNKLVEAEEKFSDVLQDMEKIKVQDEIRAHILDTAGSNSEILKIFNGAVKSLNETLGAEVVSNSDDSKDD